MSQLAIAKAMGSNGFITGPHDDARTHAGVHGVRVMSRLGNLVRSPRAARDRPSRDGVDESRRWVRAVSG